MKNRVVIHLISTILMYTMGIIAWVRSGPSDFAAFFIAVSGGAYFFLYFMDLKFRMAAPLKGSPIRFLFQNRYLPALVTLAYVAAYVFVPGARGFKNHFFFIVFAGFFLNGYIFIHQAKQNRKLMGDSPS